MAADFSITGEVKLNSDPAEKATSKWTVAAGQLIADFAKKAASSLQSVVKSGLDYNRSMESYLTNFKAKANKHINIFFISDSVFLVLHH